MSCIRCLTALILSPNATASSSTRGAIILQGPHHGAQKSTSTGTGLFKTNSSKVESVTGPAACDSNTHFSYLCAPPLAYRIVHASVTQGSCLSAHLPLSLCLVRTSLRFFCSGAARVWWQELASVQLVQTFWLVLSAPRFFAGSGNAEVLLWPLGQSCWPSCQSLWSSQCALVNRKCSSRLRDRCSDHDARSAALNCMLRSLLGPWLSDSEPCYPHL